MLIEPKTDSLLRTPSLAPLSPLFLKNQLTKPSLSQELSCCFEMLEKKSEKSFVFF